MLLSVFIDISNRLYLQSFLLGWYPSLMRAPDEDGVDADRGVDTEHGGEARHPAGVGFLLAQVGALSAQEFAELLGDLSLTPPEAGFLRSVGLRPGRSQQAIATELGVHPSRLVAFADGLERRGLLERRRDPSDRRRHEVRLTPAGSRTLRRLAAVASAHDDAVAGALDGNEREDLRRMLLKIAEAHGLSPGVHPGYGSL